LSELEKASINRIYQQKKDVNPFNLLDWNYDLEFIKNHVREQRTILITPVDIMRSLGKTEAEVQAYLDTQNPQDYSENILVTKSAVRIM
jgi:hypothetical protein